MSSKKRIVVSLLSIVIVFGSLCACGNTTQDTVVSSQTYIEQTSSLYSSDEQKAIEKFAILKQAVEADATLKSIVAGTDGYDAEIEIQNLYNDNKYSDILHQMYLYCQIVSCITIGKIGSTDFAAQATSYANEIDRDYDGPYSDEILRMATKYGSNQSGDTAFSLSPEKKKEIKAFINERYDYYDSINGGYAGDKYTSIIWKETAEKFNISTADVDLIWQGS